MKTKLSLLFILFITTTLFAQDYYPVGKGYFWNYQSIMADGKPGQFFHSFRIVEKYNGMEDAFITEYKLFVGEKQVSHIIGGLIFQHNHWISVHDSDTDGGLDTRVVFQPFDKKRINNAWLEKKDDKVYDHCEVIGTTNIEFDGVNYKNVLKVKRELTVKSGKQNGADKVFLYYDYYAPNIGLILTEAILGNRIIPIKKLIKFSKE